MNRQVLVTGGAGFIGSHLCELLNNKGYEVTVIDDLSTGKLSNIDNIPVYFIHGSITDFNLVSRVSVGKSMIFHLAANNCVPQTIEKPIEANNVNISGTLNILVAARDNHVGRVIFASSSSVYNGKNLTKKKEAMRPAPDTPYAIAKLTSEYYCDVFQKIYGLETLCLRYSSVYGEKQRCDVGHAAVIPVFIDRIKKGLPPVIYGDGMQTREFTYVKDVVAATLFLSEANKSGIYNISANLATPINELAKLLLEYLKCDLMPVYNDKRVGDVEHLSVDTSKLLKAGFSFKYSFAEGLNNLIEWSKDQ